MVLIRFADVALGYGRTTVVQKLSFEIERGDFLGIVGPNGSGKTTIVRALLGTLVPRSGKITHVAPDGRFMHYVEVSMGVVLIIVGVLLFSGRFERLAALGTSLFGFYDELALGRILLIVLIARVFLGLIPAYIAYRKGRSFWTWWLFGATLFPVAMVAAWKPD